MVVGLPVHLMSKVPFSALQRSILGHHGVGTVSFGGVEAYIAEVRASATGYLRSAPHYLQRFRVSIHCSWIGLKLFRATKPGGEQGVDSLTTQPVKASLDNQTRAFIEREFSVQLSELNA